MKDFFLAIFHQPATRQRRDTRYSGSRPSAFRLHPSSLILRPSSLIPHTSSLVLILLAIASGCAEPGPPYDRPFPLGQVTDSHWDTQMTNAQASSFVFYDHEFVGDSTKLNVLGQKHLVQVAIRLRHVPFPIVVEETPNHQNPGLDAARRVAILDRFAELGLHDLDARVIIAPAIAEGILSQEAEQIYEGSGRTIDAYGETGRGGYGGGAAQRR